MHNIFINEVIKWEIFNINCNYIMFGAMLCYLCRLVCFDLHYVLFSFVPSVCKMLQKPTHANLTHVNVVVYARM